MILRYLIGFLFLLCLPVLSILSAELPQKKSSDRHKIVLIAGPKSHGPVGNGIHDYPWSVKLLKVMLDNSNIRDKVQVEYHLEGWPENPETLNDADTIMVISDGRDGEKFTEAPHFASAAHLKQIQQQIDRGCGFLTFHFSTFAPDQYAKQIQNWSGGYFDWEENGKRKWYSAIKTLNAPVMLPHPEHPICRGVEPFELREEFYYNIRFQPADQRLTTLLEVSELKGRPENGNIVAWAKERSQGGRGFGTTCGHYYDNWQNAAFRKFILNAIAWTAGVNIPQSGVEARYYTHQEITTALAGMQGTEPALVDTQPIRVLMFAGNEAHAWHNWKKTTPVIKQQLERDPRIKVDITNDIEDLSKKNLQNYQVIVQNYTNWHDKTPLSKTSRNAFMNYLQQGGGLILIHFANGAFHFSLPQAGESDWPEYRKIVRRVWNHHGKGEQKSGHDAFGDFTVKITDNTHPLTRNLDDFPVTDELYFRQDGTEPVEPLITARSRVTKNNEPLAWTYHYGKGRIFQTLLGHSEKTYDSFAATEMLRRATAWAAGRPIHEFAPPPISQIKPAQKETLVPGKWGKALNANAGSVLTKTPAGFLDHRPLTAEGWVKLHSQSAFNILLACDPKSAAAHWEMYSYAGSGFFSVYLPGQGGEFKTGINICDDEWHYVAMILEDSRLRLYVDGKQALDSKLPKRTSTEPVQRNIAFGRLVENRLGCDGLLDDFRISKGTRDFTIVPTAPLKQDDNTLFLLSFDLPDKIKISARSEPGKPVRVETAATEKARDHWGKDAVGFDQPVEETSDNRWQQTEMGSWLACTVPLPTGPVKKGLSIRVGENQAATICYDTAHGKVRGIWSNGFLKPSPERFGLIRAPSPVGQIHFSTAEGPGWEQHCQFIGSHVNRNRVTLEYRIGETTVFETPWYETSPEKSYFTRAFEIGPGQEELNLIVTAASEVQSIENHPHRMITTKQNRPIMIGCVGGEEIHSHISPNKEQGVASFVIPPRKTTQRFLIYYQISPDGNPDTTYNAPNLSIPDTLQTQLIPGPPRWTETITTEGVLSQLNAPYVVDTLTIPHKNPYRALFFISGHDFLENGDMAVSTVHGDVWLVSGIDADLTELKWKRFATGLFQPLGLKVVNNKIHVLGRDQITILHDQNLDGEADFYECFNNQIPTSVGGHDYVTCLETDSFGNFFFMHAQQGVMQISRNGKRLNQIASGFRNPNGMGMGPGNIITASPQEGNWTPASNVTEVKQGGYYGFGGPQIMPDRPLGYDPPLCWIPRLQDNSSGGQVWVTSPDWGPLEGQLLHLSYGQSKLLLTLREVIAGQSQGGTLTLPLEFESGIMRGRFRPEDGQLYVSGLRGWVTNAVRDGCLQRVRYTGKPVHLPVAVKTMQNGIALTFTNPLDRQTAENPDNYAIEQWNYLWSQNYGSPEYRVSAPQTEGRDEVEVISATLLPDQRTVFLELPRVIPVMQMGITWQLTSQSGELLKQTYYHTINSVSSRKMEDSILARRQKNELLSPTQVQQLKPGILWRFKQNLSGGSLVTDARSSRLLALSVGPAEPVTPFLKPGRFSASAEGYLRVPIAGDYELSLEGSGTARLKVNQQQIIQVTDSDFKQSEPVTVHLKKGYNQLQLDYQSQPDGRARLRLLWKGEDFAAEPILPQLLSHTGNDSQLLERQQVRYGRELLAEFKCIACHTLPDEDTSFTLARLQADQFLSESAAMPELSQTAPDLKNIGTRVTKRWLFHWLLNPQKLRSHSRMPALLGNPAEKQTIQKAADLTAWFVSQARKPDSDNSKTPDFSSEDNSGKFLTAGAKSYEVLGCINCHHFSVTEEPDEYHRHSLAFIKRKFTASQLIRFLKSPHEHHRWSRMPDFKLSTEEAVGLAVYLIENSKGKIQNAIIPPAGSANRGKTLYETLGCVQCHSSLQESQLTATGLQPVPIKAQSLSAGCLAETEKKPASVPDFTFHPEQHAAIQAVLKTESASLFRRSDSETAERWFHQLNCSACHTRDSTSSPRATIVAEEGESGLPPEPLPSLTWAGEKLKPHWSETFIGGQLSWRPRPWLKSRMPAFPAHAALLARGMAAEHGKSIHSTNESSKTELSQLEKQIQLGHQLTSKTALDCRQCHGVGDNLPTGDDKTKIAPGINFVHIRERLDDDYYRRFVLDPPRFDISTKMPRLSSNGKTTKITNILDGNADLQFQAIWRYIQSLDDQPRSFRNN
ncbi:ThuA domain-containing protein [Gimesia maris]|uniref:ThuA domain-containing protein n=1 Tax=Gimesia maris TaxID=122 RepID=UPI00241C5CE8|nr:ThuA domain-containing protein [Gimesia maris]|tara:strand:- start:185548 stop:192153 length:6606 start_codon:yes stop_codon:yes gene_type:complete